MCFGLLLNILDGLSSFVLSQHPRAGADGLFGPESKTQGTIKILGALFLAAAMTWAKAKRNDPLSVLWPRKED